MKSREVYVCYTVRHIFISLLKNFKSKSSDNNIIIITDHIINYKHFAEILEELTVFKDVIIVEDLKWTEIFNAKKTNFIFFKKKLIRFFDEKTQLNKKMNSDDYANRVYMFLDEPRTSQYLMFKKFEIVLVEDGIGLYGIEKISFKKIIKGILGIPKTKGKDKAIKYIEATDPNKLIKSLRKKTIKLNIECLQNNINIKEMETLSKIFFVDKYEVKSDNSLLLLTQPFSEDKCISESEKISIYNNILGEYSKKYNIHIKPHPRELTEYNKHMLYPFIEIERNFPIEFMNLIPGLSFDLVVTINSSAIDFIKIANNRQKLGIEYDIKLSNGYHSIFGIKKQR